MNNALGDDVLDFVKSLFKEAKVDINAENRADDDVKADID